MAMAISFEGDAGVGTATLVRQTQKGRANHVDFNRYQMKAPFLVTHMVKKAPYDMNERGLII
jgi:hypothetical protein